MPGYHRWITSFSLILHFTLLSCFLTFSFILCLCSTALNQIQIELLIFFMITLLLLVFLLTTLLFRAFFVFMLATLSFIGLYY